MTIGCSGANTVGPACSSRTSATSSTFPRTHPGRHAAWPSNSRSSWRVATAGDSGTTWVSALTCNRRPGRIPCAGNLAVHRTDVPPTIEWLCTFCGDDGVISGWERSPFDLRPRRSDPGPTDAVQVVVSGEVAGTLRSLMLIDSTSERLVFRARAVDDVVVLDGDEDDLDELTGYVAAEANHEENRRRRKRLETPRSRRSPMR